MLRAAPPHQVQGPRLRGVLFLMIRAVGRRLASTLVNLKGFNVDCQMHRDTDRYVWELRAACRTGVGPTRIWPIQRSGVKR